MLGHSGRACGRKVTLSSRTTWLCGTAARVRPCISRRCREGRRLALRGPRAFLRFDSRLLRLRCRAGEGWRALADAEFDHLVALEVGSGPPGRAHRLLDLRLGGHRVPALL